MVNPAPNKGKDIVKINQIRNNTNQIIRGLWLLAKKVEDGFMQF
jgi:hypothetical protein